MHRNRVKRARLVKAIVDMYYEPQSQRGSMIDVFRRKVRPLYPMSEATFYRLMQIAVAIDGYIGDGQNRVEKHVLWPEPPPNDGQLTLF